jgi:hypothetical protein
MSSTSPGTMGGEGVGTCNRLPSIVSQLAPAARKTRERVAR